MSHRFASALLLVAATATLAPAQTAGRTPDGSGRTARTGVHSYSESVSRDLFSACDADSDDRLDVFEASDALDSVAGPKDSGGFLRLDTDRDGFVSWPEFDQHFWNTVQRGGPFHVRPCRSLIEQGPERQEARPASPLQVFLRLHDKNGNGGLDADELEQMLRATNLPPTIGGQLRGLDLDKSGRVDEAELAPVWELLRPLVAGAGGARGPMDGMLPPPWQAADLDGNGRLDLAEFTAVLRRLDPALARWATHLLRALDRDGDGGLGAKELPPPKAPVRHGTAAHHRLPPSAAPAGTLTQALGDVAVPPATSR